MRIAINARFLLPGKLEGLGHYTHEIVRRMVQQNPEDQFLLLFDRAFDPQFVYGPNVEPMAVFPPARHPLLWMTWFETSLPFVLERWKPDVFFSPDGYVSLRSKVPTLVTMHDVLPLRHPELLPRTVGTYYRYFMPRFARRAEKIATVSDYVRHDIADACNVSTDKIDVVYNGCRDGFKPLNDAEQQNIREAFAEGQPYFFYTGAIHPRKNVHRLIHAFDAFKRQSGSQVRLLLAGRFAWQTGEVRTAYEQSPFKNHIRFLGYIPEADLQNLTASALALCLVSLNEGFGLPIIEAFNTDTPVLSSSVSALPEVAGNAALLVNPLDENAIADALMRLHTDVALRKGLIEKGRERRKAFSWDKAAAEVYEILKKMNA
ncbi:MAG: glycosyltransferase family 4 protein [Saprospiraceae bacterium]|nr:glycosyltransferase family 4 protein [Saprospiraceae bacterium]